MKFGKLPAREDERTLRLSRYLSPNLPPPDPAFDILPRVAEAVGVHNVGALYPMDGNDELGDCVACAVAHSETIWDGMCGKKRVPRASDVRKMYFRLTGGRDSGLAELSTLRIWRKKGLLGERILAFASMDPSGTEMLKTALSLFGCLFVGFEVQRGCIADFNAGRPWMAGPKTGGGHAVVLTGYDDEGLSLLTWGAVQRAEWGWLEMVDELYACLPGQGTLPGFTPGVDYAALKSDLAAITA